MVITAQDLAAFVAKSDELGGPGRPATEEYWANFTYRPAVMVDTALDPDSGEYLTQMLELYTEISSRTLDQKTNELTHLNIGELIDLESPYAFQDPGQRAIHYLRLSKSIQVANLGRSARVLDMGCGWGLSSELLAQLGCHVSAVDINPSFVELVRQRANRLGLRINVIQSTFEEYVTEPMSFDAVLFYECFHHAVKPRDLLRNMYSFLKQSGTLILAGEPIQDLWWPNWGLRLDALSVYCIRKFGWFESGWSESYLRKILAENNFLPVIYDHPDPSIGKFVMGKRDWVLGRHELVGCASPEEWWIEGEWLVSNRSGRSSSLIVNKPKDAMRIFVDIWNFGPHSMDIAIAMDREDWQVTLHGGLNHLAFDCSHVGLVARCTFTCNSWCPKELLGSADERLLGFHLQKVSFGADPVC